MTARQNAIKLTSCLEVIIGCFRIVQEQPHARLVHLHVLGRECLYTRWFLLLLCLLEITPICVDADEQAQRNVGEGEGSAADVDHDIPAHATFSLCFFSRCRLDFLTSCCCFCALRSWSITGVRLSHVQLAGLPSR